MEDDRVYELRAELDQLLKKQVEALESRSLGTATDTDLLEYEIRQEIIHELCHELAHSVSGSARPTEPPGTATHARMPNPTPASPRTTIQNWRSSHKSKGLFRSRFGVLCVDGCLRRFHEVLSPGKRSPNKFGHPRYATERRCGPIRRSLDHWGEFANPPIARNWPAVLACSRNT
jgi:hypothetical protein